LVFFWDFLWSLVRGNRNRFLCEEIGEFEVLLIYCGIPEIREIEYYNFLNFTLGGDNYF